MLTGPMNASLTTGKVSPKAQILACALALAACTPKTAVQHPLQVGDQAVARLNGEAVWASDVKREAVLQGLVGPGEPLDVSTQVFHQALDEVIDQKLLAAEATRRGLGKDALVQRRLAAARDRVLADILLETSVAKVVNDKAVSGLYQEMLKSQSPAEETRLRQIVLGSQAEADEVRRRLVAGGAFDALAQERSRDAASRFKGGQLPPVTLDLLSEAYATALRGAKPGQLLGPFKTDAGWVVARVDERRPAAPIDLDVARPRIVRFLTYDQVKDLILNLRRGAKVQTLIGPVSPRPQAQPQSAKP